MVIAECKEHVWIKVREFQFHWGIDDSLTETQKDIEVCSHCKTKKENK